MKRKKVVKKFESEYDITLLLLVIFLCVFGIVMIYSTSSFNAYKYYQDSKKFLIQQAIVFGVGFVVMIVASLVDYHVYFKGIAGTKINLAIIGFVLFSGLLVYTTIKGHSVNGASRWIPIGSFNIQPSEFLKIMMILIVSYLASRKVKRSNPKWTSLNYFTGFLKIALIVGVPIALVADENLSTAIILALILFGVCFIASKKTLYFVLTGVAGVAAGTVYILLEPYRMNRIKAWLDMESTSSGASYQIVQGLYAIASGGIWGKGLGESIQKLGLIQEVHTDMIFTVICEEFGMAGAIMVIALFLMVIWRLYRIAMNAPDLPGALITTGVLIHIASQVLINIAVVTGTIPPTGIPLPFISYGGSSLLVLMAEIGLALNVSRQTGKEMSSCEELA